MKWTLASIVAGWLVLGAGWVLWKGAVARDATLARPAQVDASAPAASSELASPAPLAAPAVEELPGGADTLVIDGPPPAERELSAAGDATPAAWPEVDFGSQLPVLYRPFSRASPAMWEHRETRRPQP